MFFLFIPNIYFDIFDELCGNLVVHPILSICFIHHFLYCALKGCSIFTKLQMFWMGFVVLIRVALFILNQESDYNADNKPIQKHRQNVKLIDK